MKTNKIIVLTALLFINGVTLSQVSVERTEVGTAGADAVTTSGEHYSYTVGGVTVTTGQTSVVTVTQGFEQPLPEEGDVFGELNPPNAFSPDGDGVNDTWIIDFPDELMNLIDVSIINRWGDEIAFIEDYNNLDRVWDGTNGKSGEFVVSGTYFYIFESKETGHKSSGWVQVIR